MSAAVAFITDPSAQRSEWRPPPRRPFRAPDGLPRGRENWRLGVAVSVVLHLVMFVLIVAPFAFMADITLIEQGAGGGGPAGGGGGGTRGTGMTQHETLRYVAIAPATPAAVVPQIVPAVQPKIDVPVPELPKVEPPKLSALTPVGAGRGTGTDGTAGSGPGSGGGVGSGIGTGRGSGAGPGTGGGRQENYPPQTMEMFIPPMPIPESVRGSRLVVQFDVDETGKVRSVNFTQTPDRGYNRRLRAVFEDFRFRPGTKPDGTPVRMIWQFEIDLP